jgi:hypothetical protein
LQYGKCKLKIERESLLDKAKIKYTDKLLHGSGEQPVMASSSIPATTKDISPKGWALKKTKSNTRFNDQAKSYLNEKFEIGKQSGHKLDPATVSRDMRYAKDQHCNRRFSLSEFLTPQQVQSYFSRRASKQKNRQEKIPEADRAAAEDQTAYSNTRSTTLEECQLVHPIVLDSYNLCNLTATNGLTKMSVSLLRMICEHFDIDISGISCHRKAPYIDLIRNMVNSCSCSA